MKLQPVYIVWKDAESHDEWDDTKEFGGELPDIHTLGFIIKETKTSIVVAQNMDVKNDKSSMVMTIPKSWCASIKKLKLP